MSTKIGSLYGDVTLRTASLDKAVQSVGKKLGKLSADMGKLGKEMSLKLTAPIAAFGAVSVKAFAEQEKAEAKLREALRASGQEVDANFGKLSRMASEIQKVTTVGDEMSLSLAQQAISMGLQADQVDEAVRGAIALSKAYDLELNTAIRASTAAVQGQTEMLTRYIPELKAIEDPAERVALVQQKMAEGFSIAEAEAGTTEGRLIQLKNAFGDLQEQIGAIIAEYLTPLVEKLREVVKELEQTDNETVRLVVQIVALTAALGPLLMVLSPVVKLLSQAWTWVILLGVGLGILIDKMGPLREAGTELGNAISFFADGKIAQGVAHLAAMFAELTARLVPFVEIDGRKVADAWARGLSAVATAADFAARQFERLIDLAVRFHELSGMAGASRTLTRLIAGSEVAPEARAMGGPVTAGAPYLVGERGPELFVPGMSGAIIPNHAMSGGGNTNITMNFAAGLGMDFIAAVKNNRSIFEKIAVEAVKEQQMRTR